MERVHWAAAAAVVGVALGAGVWFGGRGPEPPPPVSIERGTDPAAAGTVAVHVSGAVVRPGVVEVAPAARVADAIAAAGGATADADLRGINLAAPVVDGGQVVVPDTRHPPPSAPGGAGPGPLRLNAASAAELESLPGVGPVTAARIVAHRQQHGPFAVIEDLLDVPGIGEGRLATLRDLVVVP